MDRQCNIILYENNFIEKKAKHPVLRVSMYCCVLHSTCMSMLLVSDFDNSPDICPKEFQTSILFPPYLHTCLPKHVELSLWSLAKEKQHDVC